MHIGAIDFFGVGAIGINYSTTFTKIVTYTILIIIAILAIIGLITVIRYFVHLHKKRKNKDPYQEWLKHGG